MAGEPGPCEVFYASAWQHPLALWVAAAAGAVVCRARRAFHRGVRRSGLALALLSACDAWLTADRIFGIGALPAPLTGVVPLFFVLAGDFRYLLLWEAATPEGAIAPSPTGVGRAALLTAIVPIFAQVVTAGGGRRGPLLLLKLPVLPLRRPPLAPAPPPPPPPPGAG